MNFQFASKVNIKYDNGKYKLNIILLNSIYEGYMIGEKKVRYGKFQCNNGNV